MSNLTAEGKLSTSVSKELAFRGQQPHGCLHMQQAPHSCVHPSGVVRLHGVSTAQPGSEWMTVVHIVLGGVSVACDRTAPDSSTLHVYLLITFQQWPNQRRNATGGVLAGLNLLGLVLMACLLQQGTKAI